MAVVTWPAKHVEVLVTSQVPSPNIPKKMDETHSKPPAFVHSISLQRYGVAIHIFCQIYVMCTVRRPRHNSSRKKLRSLRTGDLHLPGPRQSQFPKCRQMVATLRYRLQYFSEKLRCLVVTTYFEHVRNIPPFAAEQIWVAGCFGLFGAPGRSKMGHPKIQYVSLKSPVAYHHFQMKFAISWGESLNSPVLRPKFQRDWNESGFTASASTASLATASLATAALAARAAWGVDAPIYNGPDPKKKWL